LCREREEAGNSLRGEANSQGIFTWTEGRAGNISGKRERGREIFV